VPLNDKDLLLQNIRLNKEGLIAKMLPPTSDVEPDSCLAVWDIVLDQGVTQCAVSGRTRARGRECLTIG
jgi:hypothetical protein